MTRSFALALALAIAALSSLSSTRAQAQDEPPPEAPDTLSDEPEATYEEETYEEETPEEETPEAETPDPSFHAQLGAGLGVGLRDIAAPSLAGERTVQTGLFTALDIDMRASQRVGSQFLFGARLRYQTSLGMVGQETPYGGVERETSMRAHHVEAGLEPALRFVSSPESVVLGAFVGWSIRGLRTESGLSVPDYTVHGPALRLVLLAPLRGSDVVLRLEPELVAWVVASGAIQKMSALEPTGMAYGGQASLHIRLVDSLALELAYRGSYGAIRSTLGGSLTDTEHYATLQLALVY